MPCKGASHPSIKNVIITVVKLTLKLKYRRRWPCGLCEINGRDGRAIVRTNETILSRNECQSAILLMLKGGDRVSCTWPTPVTQFR